MRLPKLEIPKFCGDAKKLPEFLDSYEAAINKSNLLYVENFNYLKTLVTGEATNAILGLSLTNDNYGEAINILKDRFGNKRSLSYRICELNAHREVELNVRSLVTLGVAVESFGTLVSTVVIDKLTPNIKLLIARHIKDTWNLTKILQLLNEELKARETVNVEGKNVDSDEILPFTGSSLVVGSRGTSHQSVKCCFCKGSHWSDKCHVVTDAVARKEFLKKGDQRFLCLGEGHISRNCQKSKRCFCCKGLRNSAICENKITKNNMAENSDIISSTNYSANSSCVLLQTAEIILVNMVNKREIKVKTLFDEGPRRSYITERVKSFLKLIPTSHEYMSISAFRNKTPEKKELQKVCFNFKNALRNYFSI